MLTNLDGRDSTLRRLVLTAREHQVVELAAEGLADKEIAAELRLSTGTVRTFLRRAYARNEVVGRVALIVAWLRSQSSRGELQAEVDESSEVPSEPFAPRVY